VSATVTVFGVVWIAGFWLLVLAALAVAATFPLMRRREPDPPDDPAAHGLAREAVTFPSRDGLRLGGWWIPAQGRGLEHACGTIVLCPGQNGSLDKDVPQAVPLVQAGFNVLMFDFRAHGRSEGDLVTLGALEQADLFGALDYLAAERGVDHVGVLGLSMGAGVALLVAAQDERVAALVVDGAFPRVAGLLVGYLRERGVPPPLARGAARGLLWAASLRAHYRLADANPLDLAGRVKVPVLLIHGDRDPFVTPAEVAALAAHLGQPSAVWRVAEASHREAFTLRPDEYNRRVVEWFERFLECGCC
jgi:uncharacterized protein